MHKLCCLLVLLVACTSTEKFGDAPPSSNSNPASAGPDFMEPEDPDDQSTDTDGEPDEGVSIQGQLCTVVDLASLSLNCTNQAPYSGAAVSANDDATLTDENGYFSFQLSPDEDVRYLADAEPLLFPSLVDVSISDLSPVIPMIGRANLTENLAVLGQVLQDDTAQVLLKFVNGAVSASGIVATLGQGQQSLPFYDTAGEPAWSLGGTTGSQGAVLIPNATISNNFITIQYDGAGIVPGMVDIPIAADRLTIATVSVVSL